MFADLALFYLHIYICNFLEHFSLEYIIVSKKLEVSFSFFWYIV